MLKDAREQCDWLVAALHIDPSIERPNKNAPVQSLGERRIQLESIKYVDEIHTYETEKDLLFILSQINPHVRILGSDYMGKDFTGMELDIKIHYHERLHSWSTSELRHRIQAT